MTTPSLTILFPCLNEALGIAEVVREYAAVFPQADILVVDNGSDDGTAAAARAAGAAVITERRRGKATAVATALAAIDSDLILMVDGDGSYPAEGGRLLIEQYLSEPVDMITGIRSAQKATQVLRPMHQWGMSIFAGVLNAVFRFKPLDLFSGLRLFSRRFYKHVPVLSRGFELEIELTIQAVDKGFAQTEIPVPFRSRARGSESKLKTIRDGLRIFRLLVVLFRDYRPLTFFGNLAGVAALLGLLAGSVPIAEYFTTGLVNRLPLAVLAASLVTLSIIIGLVGLLLEANLRYHREAYHIQLRKYGAPVVRRATGRFPRVNAG
jgi:glycosyltransferase involved in cell wall biosynthesis